MKNRVGWVGVGIMGLPMASNLLKKGFEVFAYDLSENALKRICELGAVSASLAEIGAGCDIIVTILPNGSIVHDVLFCENGIAANAKPGTLVIDMSSVTPTESLNCAKELKEKGIEFLDAPVSGGQEGAENASLAIMAGGTPENVSIAMPVLEALSTSITHVGDVGSGSVTKLANQVIVNLTIAAVSEGLILAKKAGVEPGKVFEAIRGGLAGSRVLEDKVPRMMERRFEPGGSLAINRKDIGNVLKTAHDYDVPLPLCSLLYEEMQSLKVDGHITEDHSAIVKFYEKLAGTEV